MRWDKCRYYYDRYVFYAVREVWEWKFFYGDREYDKAGQYVSRSYKDYSKSRKGYELFVKEKGRYYFSSFRVGSFYVFFLYFEKYVQEKVVFVVEDNIYYFVDRFYEYEIVKVRKRRYDSLENVDSYIGKKVWRSLLRDFLEEFKVKKYKKLKKKKKFKDKYRDRDFR